MKRHLLLLLFRVCLAVGVALALPFSHVQWGEMYPGDGQSAFGFLIVFGIIGFAAAAVFIVLGSLAHFSFRRKHALVTMLADLVLFCLFAGVLAYEGATAGYTDTKPGKSAATECLFVVYAFDSRGDAEFFSHAETRRDWRFFLTRRDWRFFSREGIGGFSHAKARRREDAKKGTA